MDFSKTQMWNIIFGCFVNFGCYFILIVFLFRSMCICFCIGFTQEFSACGGRRGQWTSGARDADSWELLDVSVGNLRGPLPEQRNINY